MAKLMRLVQCTRRGCDRFFEIEFPDVIVRNPTALRFDVRCPAKGCGSVVKIDRAFYDELRAAAEPTKESKPAPRADTPDEKLAKGLRAEAAVQAAGGKAKAAEALGVSVQTVTNWLKYLPETADT